MVASTYSLYYNSVKARCEKKKKNNNSRYRNAPFQFSARRCEWDDWWKLKLKRKKRSMRSFVVYLDMQRYPNSVWKLLTIHRQKEKKEIAYTKLAVSQRVGPPGLGQRGDGEQKDLINWKGAVSFQSFSTCLLCPSSYSGTIHTVQLSWATGRKSRWEIKPLKGNFSYYMAWCLYQAYMT